MRRRRRLPPDTRPKWNDPQLDKDESLKYFCTRVMEHYDRLPRFLRDICKQSKDGELPS